MADDYAMHMEPQELKRSVQVPTQQPSDGGTTQPGKSAAAAAMLPAYCDPPNPCPPGYTPQTEVLLSPESQLRLLPCFPLTATRQTLAHQGTPLRRRYYSARKVSCGCCHASRLLRPAKPLPTRVHPSDGGTTQPGKSAAAAAMLPAYCD